MIYLLQRQAPLIRRAQGSYMVDLLGGGGGGGGGGYMVPLIRRGAMWSIFCRDN